MSTVGQTCRGSLWWLTRAILILVVAGIAAGIWCVYEGVSVSLHAEKGLHATRLTLEIVEEYVAQHNGAWPRSWTDLEQTSGKISEVYRMTGGREHVADYVWIDFDADPGRLAKQTESEFEAIRPVGPFYPSYRVAVPSLLEALRK